jgi:hypothetical protein
MTDIPDKNGASRFPEDISKYIDLKSPILKYLIEIEKKHWNSEINKNFVFPKTFHESDSISKGLTDDDASIRS